jgi:chromosomal replication initiation ATPase DnaA
LRDRFSRANWETYIAPLELTELRGSRAIIRAPSTFVAEWVGGRFSSALAGALAAAAGRPITVDVIAA